MQIQDGSGVPFTDWITGTVQGIGDAAAAAWVAQHYPERVPDVDPSAPVQDSAVNEDWLAAKQAEDRNRLLLIAGAGVLAVVLILSVSKR